MSAGNFDSRVNAYQVKYGPSGNGICFVEANGNASLDNEANARLIAAAPDLLDALQRFVTACDAYLPEPTHQAFCGLFASARAAIAKATGEA